MRSWVTKEKLAYIALDFDNRVGEVTTKEQDEKYKNLQATIEKESAKTAEESAI